MCWSGRCRSRARGRRRSSPPPCAASIRSRPTLLAPQQQRLDELSERLPRALRTELSHARAALAQIAGALRPGLLDNGWRRAKERLEALWRVAELAHPSRPLARGYARVED